ncbi:MAG: UDP-3-O-acyl-N-acetylglucosamine deacetylase [Sneathiellaceae bacterium]
MSGSAGVKNGLMMFQRTVQQGVRCSGIGLHTGKPVAADIRPAEADRGILFRRVDLPGMPEIPARFDLGTDFTLGTTLRHPDGAASVATVEHLMAALAGLGIDNAVVDVDGPEVPAVDGSAAPFVALLRRAGLRTLGQPRRAIRVLKPVVLSEGSKSVALEPAATFSVSVTIDFENPVIGQQTCTFTPSVDDFGSQLAPARTFGLLQEVDWMRRQGLALGGSLDNAIVINGNTVMNQDGLRFVDEFARHKVLDALGDLALAGAPLQARFLGNRSGHALNNRLLHALFADDSAWEWVDMAARHGTADLPLTAAAL